MRFSSSFSYAMVATSVALITLIALSLSTMDADSYQSGITDRTETGCTCHSGSVSKLVEPILEGLPSSYEPGKVYDLEISFTGGPEAGPNARAGFNLRMSEGTLTEPQGSDQIRVDPAGLEATHTTEGNKVDSWSIQWEAPEEGSGDVEVVLVVNVVNGDGEPTSNDLWGRTRMNVEGTGGAFYTFLLIAVLIVIVIVVIWMMMNKSEPTPEKPAGSSTRKQGKKRRR
jgi:hypothetical protein